MIPALLVFLLAQDVEALESDDIAERDAAVAELKKLPLEKLPLLEGSLDHKDAEVRVRAREIVTHVLESALGCRKTRFACAPVADREVMEKWVADGADPKSPPKGYEAVRLPEHRIDETTYPWLAKRDYVLVESTPTITNEHVKAAEAVEDQRKMSKAWKVNFELDREGATRFDEAAEVLFQRWPKGMLAIMVDDRLISAPAIHAEDFDGRAEITGSFDEAEAKRIARILKGLWHEFSFRVLQDRAGAAPLDDAEKILRAAFGKEALSRAEKGVTVTAEMDVRSIDLVGLWRALWRSGYRLAPAEK